MGHRTRAAIAVVSGMIALAGTLLGTAAPAAAHASVGTTAVVPTDAYCVARVNLLVQWSAGYLAEVTIRNISTVTVRWQVLILSLPDPIVSVQIWNATTTQSGSVVTIYPSPPASGVLTPGETRTIGFISSSRPLVALPTALVTCTPV